MRPDMASRRHLAEASSMRTTLVVWSLVLRALTGGSAFASRCIALAALTSSLTALAAETAPPAPKLGIYRPHLQLDLDRCVSVEDRARAERAAKPQAFSSEVGIYLPPLYWASRDRTFEQIML